MSYQEKLDRAKAYIAERNIKPFWERRASVEDPRYSLDDPGLMDAVFIDNQSTAPIRPQRAIQTSAVYACVRVLSETVSTLPLVLYRSTKVGSEKATSHPLYDLLHFEPNSYQNSVQFFEQAMAHAVLWGNFYAEIQRDVRTGRVIGLYPLNPWQVTPRLVSDGFTMRKVYDVAGKQLSDEEIFHFPALGWDGVKGVSPIALHRSTLHMTLNAEEFGANFFKNGTRISGVLKHPGNLSKDAATRLRESWQKTYGGKGNAGKVAVLEEGMDFTALTMPLADAQFIEQRKFQVNDICRIFRVPPHMVGDLDRATFSNIEQQGIEFVQYTLMPWLVRFEQEVRRKLIPKNERETISAKFDVDSLQRGDFNNRVKGYASARQWGWMSANEIRSKENMNQIDGGDTYLSPVNMQDSAVLDAADQDESQDGGKGSADE